MPFRILDLTSEELHIISTHFCIKTKSSRSSTGQRADLRRSTVLPGITWSFRILGNFLLVSYTRSEHVVKKVSLIWSYIEIRLEYNILQWNGQNKVLN